LLPSSGNLADQFVKFLDDFPNLRSKFLVPRRRLLGGKGSLNALQSALCALDCRAELAIVHRFTATQVGNGGQALQVQFDAPREVTNGAQDRSDS
jgi:hypothetical protein